MSLIKKFGRKLALGVICSVIGTAAYATPFAVQVSFYGEEAPPLANIKLAFELVDGNGTRGDSSVKIWSAAPVSSRVGSISTLTDGWEYRMDDSIGSSSMQFATINRGVMFYMDWAGLSASAAGAQAFDKLTLKILDAQGRALPTLDKSGNNFLATYGQQSNNFSTSFLYIDHQIPAGADPFVVPAAAPIPEPGSLGMMALGMSCLALIARRRRNLR